MTAGATGARMRRRELIAGGVASAGMLALGPQFWRSLASSAQPGPGPYGPLGNPDANGLRLPAGFSSREIARGALPVSGTSYPWHIFSDGAATFGTADGGWILVSNSEVPTPVDLPPDPPVGAPRGGGASAIRFSKSGAIVDAYRILSGTSSNCAGGPTPWGTWLSCEEIETGTIWECDPTGGSPPREHPAMGVFTHEAVCVDPRTGFAYLSEDEGDGCFYRYRPLRRGDLSTGVLEVARRGSGDAVTWSRVPDPLARATPTREQVPTATRFRRGEGIWFDSGFVYLATTQDSRIWLYSVDTETMGVLYDAGQIPSPPLTDVDNITVAPRSRDLYVCEDNGAPDAFDLAIITPPRNGQRSVARFLKATGPQHGDPNSELSSELAGVAFNPRGDRMYFASQRAYGVGVVYEVTGPFRGVA
jgi:secreted PhoX family phosphatase